MKKRYLKVPRFRRGVITTWEIFEIKDIIASSMIIPNKSFVGCISKGYTTFNCTIISKGQILESKCVDILKYEFNIEDNNIEI